MTDQKPATADPGHLFSPERLVTAKASRRQILKAAAFAGVGAVATQVLAACAPAAASIAPSAAPSGTASGTTTSPSTSAAARRSLDPTKTVRVWFQGYTPEQTKVQNDIAAKYKQETGLSVAFETVDWSTAEQRWNLAMSTGDLPDIGDMFYLPSRIVQGQGKWGPLNLNPYMDAGMFDSWDRIVEAARLEPTFDGKVYGIPWRYGTLVWNGRTDLWPKVPATLDEMEKQGLEVIAKHGLDAAGVWWLSGTDDVNAAGLAYGTTILTDDYKASNLLDPKWIEAATWMRETTRKKILSSHSLDKGFDINAAFFSGQAGAQWAGSTVLSAAQAQAPDAAPYIISGLMPAGPVGASRSHGSCAQWSIFENSTAIDESVAFLSWLTQDPQLSKQVCDVTSNLAADTDVMALQSTPYLEAFIHQAETAHFTDMPIPAWGEMRVAPDGPLEVLGQRIIQSDDDLATLFKTADSQIKDIFAKYS